MSESDASLKTKRYEWDVLPAELRSAVEELLGAAVVGAVTQPGGYTAGVASVLTLTNGDRVFAKAVPETEETARGYRHEAMVSRQLPIEVPAPHMRFSVDEFGWVLLCFDAIDGRLPHEPWHDVELDAAVTSMNELAAMLTPNPVAGLEPITEFLGDEINTWRSLHTQGAVGDFRCADLPSGLQQNIHRLAELEVQWAESVAGDTLVHLDMRSDNFVLDANDKMWVVDWSWPSVGAPWVDLVTFLPSVERPPSELSEILDGSPVAAGLSSCFANAHLAMIAGVWLCAAAQPPYEHAPTMRALQRRCGWSALNWLQQRGFEIGI